MDNNAGAGGSYLIDPDTGERVLVERTKDAKEKADEAPVPKPEPKKTVKFKE